MFTVAELVTVYTNPFTGIALHAITLSALLIGAGLGGQSDSATEQPLARLLHALALVPLIRIVSLIFAILHTGYRSGTDLLFVFLIALLYGWVVRRTGSIIGVSVSHGVTNITLFLLVPFIPVLSAPPDWLPPLY